MKEVTNCPHCKGELKKTDHINVDWQFGCKRCGRAWIILDNKYWLAGFDAAGHVFEIDKNGKFIDHNSFRDEKLREELWNRVRK